MNESTVGLENLPNVFIDKIIVDPKVLSRAPLRIQYDVRVMVKMYDNQDDHSWRDKVSGLKIKCAFVTDGKINQLNNGNISLYDIPLGEADLTDAISCDSLRFSDRRGGYESYTGVFEYTTTIAPENLNVYVACFIDDLNFGIPQFDKFYGPMAAERIFVAGVPNSRTSYFYDPDTNEEYGGPVHFHSEGYMEGSEHSSRNHRSLRLVEEENYKLVIGSNYEGGVYAGTDISRAPEENRVESRPGFVDPDPDNRRFGPQTNIPTTEVEIEDPNVPTDIPTEIY